jgi:hypothetical protein
MADKKKANALRFPRSWAPRADTIETGREDAALMLPLLRTDTTWSSRYRDSIAQPAASRRSDLNAATKMVCQ